MPKGAAPAIVVIGAALAAAAGRSQGIAPLAGHAPPTAARAEAGAPTLARIPDAKLGAFFDVDPSYPRAASAHVQVVGAFTLEPPRHSHLVAAWSAGYLPVALSFSDGRCYLLTADYFRGTLSNGRLTASDCTRRFDRESHGTMPPAARSLRWVGASWGYEAWADDRAGTTIITAPFSKTFEPLLIAHLPAMAMMAMNSPDSPTGNVTLVGPIGDRLTVVTLAVSY